MAKKVVEKSLKVKAYELWATVPVPAKIAVYHALGNLLLIVSNALLRMDWNIDWKSALTLWLANELAWVAQEIGKPKQS